MKENLFYPELSEAGKREAQEYINNFKKKLLDVVNEVVGDVYCNIVHDIESDSWSNFRNQIMEGYRYYRDGKINHRYDFSAIRKAILEEYREEIIDDLNQDNLEEIENLKERIEYLEEELRMRY